MMAYTVKQVARWSGVSVRTLHFYDEAGLLKPAYTGANGYRFYEEPQLLRLQQILFYRELGFDLKGIQRILGRRDFEVISALRCHRRVLQERMLTTRQLIATIDKTIKHLKGRVIMKNKEMFAGFDPAQQAKHEQYLIDRYGEKMRAGIAASKAKVKDWSKADWDRSGAVFHEICEQFVDALRRGLAAEAPQVQEIVRRHYEWLKQFWTPTKESYTGHSHLIVDSDLRKPYEAHHPQLPEYAARAMRAFAVKALE